MINDLLRRFTPGTTTNPQWTLQAKRSLSFVRPFRSDIALILALLLFVSALGAAEPVVYIKIFDRLWGTEFLAVISLGLLALLVMGALREVIGGYANHLSWRVRLALKRSMYQSIIGHIYFLPLAYHTRETVGGIMTKLDRGINGLVEALSEVLFGIVPGMAYLVLSIAVMFRLDWRLSMLVLVFAPIPALIGMWAAEEQTVRESSILYRWGKIYGRLYEALGGIRTVKSFVMEEKEKLRFLEGVDDTHGIIIKGVATDTIVGAAKSMAALIARLLSFWLGTYLVVHKEMTVGTLLAFMGYQGGIFGPIHGLTNVYQVMRKASISLEIVYSILDHREERSVPPVQLGHSIKGDVSFDNVFFSYQSGRTILSDISFSVSAGEVIAIAGPSGAGKSTLISLLLRFYTPTAGRITIDGTNIADMDKNVLRRQVGVVLQDGIIFNDTVRNNITYGVGAVEETKMIEAARAANAHDFIMKLPSGYDTVLGEGGGTISMGERQRLTIARALLKDPPILVLDEPTSSLDAESELLVQEALRRLICGRTTLIIAHRLSTIMWADKIVVLKDGKIIEHGNPQALMLAGGYFATVAGLQTWDAP